MKQLKAEVHCHSKTNRVSYFPLIYDSVQTIEEIISTSIKKNISVLSITDHDSLTGYHLAKKIIQITKADILLIPGMEISTSKGHILAYGIREVVPSKMTPEATVDAIHQQGGIAVAAHPYMLLGVGDLVKTLPFDAIEGFNAAIPNFPNLKAQKVGETLKLPITAGSDAHQTCAIGNAHMLFPDTIKTSADVLSAIKHGNFTTRYTHTKIGDMVFEHITKSLKSTQDARVRTD